MEFYYFTSVQPLSVFCKRVSLSMLRQCRYCSHAILAEGHCVTSGSQIRLWISTIKTLRLILNQSPWQGEMCIMIVLHVFNDVCTCVIFLPAELHVFSGPEVSDQPVHSHTAGPHHSLPCSGGSGKNKHTYRHRRKHRRALDIFLALIAYLCWESETGIDTTLMSVL